MILRLRYVLHCAYTVSLGCYSCLCWIDTNIQVGKRVGSLGGWVAGSNGNKANLTPSEAGAILSLAKRLDILQKITIPVGLIGSCRWK